MMQELLNVVQQQHHNNSSSSSINSSNSSSTSDQQPQQNLRCPRCESSNTKFCYYNNYNLTQPRHFCKTCRRYWTKGGALRNVPIGGGCRKARTASPTTITSGGPSNNKGGPLKASRPVMSASDVIGLGAASDLQLPPGLAPYGSHLLTWLKATSQMQNPNCHGLSSILLNSYRIKEEVGSTAALQQNLSLNGCWNSNVDQLERAGNYNVGSNSNYYSNNGNYCLPSFTAASTTAVMESVPLHGGDTGFWNSCAAMGWSDISASNGAFP